MSNVVAIEGNKTIIIKAFKEMGALLAEVEYLLAMTRNELKDPPFRTMDVVPLAQELVREKLEPALKKIKKAQVKVEILKRMKVAKKEVAVISELVDEVLINVVLAKSHLEDLK